MSVSLPKVTIQFVKTNPYATIPVAKDNGDVGMDIHSVEAVVVPAGKCKMIDTGLQLANVQVSAPMTEKLITSVLLKIEGRSGLASKGIFPTGGIVDPSYRGVVKVVLNNATDQDYHVGVGDRIAQFVIYPVYANYFGQENVLEVSEANTITDTSRSNKGFGSSGR